MQEDSEYFLKSKLTVLAEENKELQKKLNAKRYKLADKVVDGAYRIIPKHKRAIDNSASRLEKYSNYSGSNRIDIINHNFYDWDGNILYKGGAERYVYDLAILLTRLGYKPRILQGANHSFEKDYRGISVIGVPAKCGDYRGLSKIFNKFCEGSDLIIASPTELASEITSTPCIAINHGVNFDGPWTDINFSPIGQYRIYTDALENVESCICVDTNFINWIRTKDYRLSKKLVYIPNYYDKKIFKLAKKRNKGEDITFVYPRRIYEPRGYDITIEAFRNILRDFKNVKLRFVGQIDNDKVRCDIDSILSEFPKRVSRTEYSMDEAYKAYDGADVVLVPTKYSEGTSLSCIEAQAMGIPVIATDIGGLPDLIIDHFNGILISPSARSLENAVRELLQSPELIDTLGKNAYNVARSSFTKERWNSRWSNEITYCIENIKSKVNNNREN